MIDNYLKLEKEYSKIIQLENIGAMLHSDMITFMPKGGEQYRIEQLDFVASEIHHRMTAKSLQTLVNHAHDVIDNLDEWQRANLREMTRIITLNNAISETLAARFSNLKTRAELKWQEARNDKDSKEFLPIFHELFAVVKEISEARSAALNLDKYDAMIESFDPYRRQKEIDPIFNQMKKFLPQLIDAAIEKQNSFKSKNLPQKKYEIALQEKVGRRLMELAGFNFDHGRLDTSAHPMCGGISGDVRITTRYREDEFLTSLMGVMHEAGHGNYQNNLPFKYRNMEVGKPLGMSIHESQSLLVEMLLFRSEAFFSYLKPIVKKEFSLSDQDLDGVDLFRISNIVERSLIRVDADQLTYPLHVILRYEIERDLFNNVLDIKDVEEAWNEKTKSYLGIIPSDPFEGFLQDVHWPSGTFGYFPSYSLGAIIACQLYEKIEQERNINQDISKGDFSYINVWLKNNIHQYGSLYPANELVKRATGREIDVGSYERIMKRKFL